MCNDIIENANTDCGVHYSCQTMHMYKCTFWQKSYYELNLRLMLYTKQFLFIFYEKKHLGNDIHVE